MYPHENGLLHGSTVVLAATTSGAGALTTGLDCKQAASLRLTSVAPCAQGLEPCFVDDRGGLAGRIPYASKGGTTGEGGSEEECFHGGIPLGTLVSYSMGRRMTRHAVAFCNVTRCDVLALWWLAALY